MTSPDGSSKPFPVVMSVPLPSAHFGTSSSQTGVATGSLPSFATVSLTTTATTSANTANIGGTITPGSGGCGGSIMHAPSSPSAVTSATVSRNSGTSTPHLMYQSHFGSSSVKPPATPSTASENGTPRNGSPSTTPMLAGAIANKFSQQRSSSRNAGDISSCDGARPGKGGGGGGGAISSSSANVSTMAPNMGGSSNGVAATAICTPNASTTSLQLGGISVAVSVDYGTSNNSPFETPTAAIILPTACTTAEDNHSSSLGSQQPPPPVSSSDDGASGVGSSGISATATPAPILMSTHSSGMANMAHLFSPQGQREPLLRAYADQSYNLPLALSSSPTPTGPLGATASSSSVTGTTVAAVPLPPPPLPAATPTSNPTGTPTGGSTYKSFAMHYAATSAQAGISCSKGSNSNQGSPLTAAMDSDSTTGVVGEAPISSSSSSRCANVNNSNNFVTMASVTGASLVDYTSAAPAAASAMAAGQDAGAVKQTRATTPQQPAQSHVQQPMSMPAVASAFPSFCAAGTASSPAGTPTASYSRQSSRHSNSNMERTIDVYDADFRDLLSIPASQVHHRPHASLGVSRLVLCRNFTLDNPDACTKGALCKFVHADITDATRSSIHVNYAWRSLELCTYPRLPPGDTLVVLAPNERQPSELIASERVLMTRGSVGWRDHVIPLSHCAHYYFNRMCNRGERCNFVHAIHVDPNVQGNFKRAPAPTAVAPIVAKNGSAHQPAEGHLAATAAAAAAAAVAAAVTLTSSPQPPSSQHAATSPMMMPMYTHNAVCGVVPQQQQPQQPAYTINIASAQTAPSASVNNGCNSPLRSPVLMFINGVPSQVVPLQQRPLQQQQQPLPQQGGLSQQHLRSYSGGGPGSASGTPTGAMTMITTFGSPLTNLSMQQQQQQPPQQSPSPQQQQLMMSSFTSTGSGTNNSSGGAAAAAGGVGSLRGGNMFLLVPGTPNTPSSPPCQSMNMSLSSSGPVDWSYYGDLDTGVWPTTPSSSMTEYSSHMR